MSPQAVCAGTSWWTALCGLGRCVHWQRTDILEFMAGPRQQRCKVKNGNHNSAFDDVADVRLIFYSEK